MSLKLHLPVRLLSGIVFGSIVFGGMVLGVVALGNRAIAQSSLLQGTTQGTTEPPAQYRGAPEPLTAPEIYGQGVRESQWQSPEDELAGFQLPPGFKISLFASEPQIAKPLNMAWDLRGRLWVTSTVEYPYPAGEENPARDTIKILEDTDGDGTADKVITFADGLNIPMGVLPVDDGCLCFSMPYIWHLRDTDGDDRVDEKTAILGPFDTSRDTHGMVNSLRRGIDGWIYACHGFNNQSTVTAKDGSQAVLFSGNTFRFKPDGSRVEKFTSGQVNPFGMTRDEFGNWYTADCHSKPLTALLPGGCYPSFGRPHDGLGFAPEMMQHLHGSTAISGLAYYFDHQFPPAYRGLFYSGNVMTSRINCNRLQWRGSTAEAVELADFLTSNDPWFRPVDVQIGHDGCMYIADFYNKIIGHYEVPLTHPGRDRDSGRIWKVEYTGRELALIESSPLERSRPLGQNPILAAAAVKRWVAADEFAWAAFVESEGDVSAAAFVALQVLHQRGELNSASTTALIELVSIPQDLCKLFQLATSWPVDLQSEMLVLARDSLAELPSQPIVARAAIHFLAMGGESIDIRRLLPLLEPSVVAADPALAHSAKIAIRSLLRRAEDLTSVVQSQMAFRDGNSAHLKHQLLEIVATLDTAEAALLLLAELEATSPLDVALLDAVLPVLASHASGPVVERVVGLLATSDKLSASDRSLRFADFAERAWLEPMNRAGLADAAIDLLTSELRLLDGDTTETGSAPLAWQDESLRDWPTEQRNAPGGKPTSVRSSFPLGESYQGSLVSEPFVCPAGIELQLVGHLGLPDQPSSMKNYVQLVSESNGRSLVRAFPPRSDIARRIRWDTSEWQGQAVRIEVIDGDPGRAYAWLGVGDFSLAELNWSARNELLAASSRVLNVCGSDELFCSRALNLLRSLELSTVWRARLIARLATARGRKTIHALLLHSVRINRLDLAEALLDLVPELLIDAAAESEQNQLRDVANELARSSSRTRQRQLIGSLLNSVAGCELVCDLLSRGEVGESVVAGLDTPLPPNLAPKLASILNPAMGSEAGIEIALRDYRVRLDNLDWSAANAERGRQVFQTQCAVCHQLGGVGQIIGPQLDGAIARSVDRLAEDILLPNLNVDVAFRQTILLLDDDSVLSGLLQESPDGSLSVHLSDGKTQPIAAERIVERKISERSLMPSNFGELLSDEQLSSLLEFLKQPNAASQKSR